MKKYVQAGILLLVVVLPLCATTTQADPEATKIDITIKPRLKAWLDNGYFLEIYNRNHEPIEAQCIVITPTGEQKQNLVIGGHMKWHPAVGVQGVFSSYELTVRAGNLTYGAPSTQVKTVSVKGFMLMGFYFVR